MKKYSFNYIPSFQDIPINSNNRSYPQMLFLLSQKSLNSIQSIENMENNQHPLFQPDNNISFDLFQQDSPLPKQVPIITEESFQTPIKKKKNGCVCKKIGCLKLYCECFTNKRLCTEECACINCCNVAQNVEGITSARNLRKNRVHVGEIRCNCKKSNCQKKYCQCFNAKIACGAHCNCRECLNPEKNACEEKRERQN